MPLYKKQPFPLAEKPNDLKPFERVFQVPFTNELFRDYSEYLKRINLYRRRVWKSKASRKTNLTYQEALVSEKKAAEKVNQFPIEFAAPVLREVQFSMLPLRDLVNAIFAKLQGPLAEGNELYARKSSCVYPCKIVKVLESDHKTDYEVLWLGKDKKVSGNSLIKGEDLIVKLPFSKEVLKSFIRESTYRCSPWVLLDNVAKLHGISSHPPEGPGVNLSISIQNGLVMCRKRKKAEDEKTLPGQSQTTTEGLGVKSSISIQYGLVECSRKRKKPEDEKMLPGQSQTTTEGLGVNSSISIQNGLVECSRKRKKPEDEKTLIGQSQNTSEGLGVNSSISIQNGLVECSRKRKKAEDEKTLPGPRQTTTKEDVIALDILIKKMPTHKRGYEDTNDNHDKTSKDIPQPKRLRKKPPEKSSYEQKEPLEEPIVETLCQRRSVSVKQTENFSKLPYELLVEIAKRLKLLEDFTCFRSVTRSSHLYVEEEHFEGLRFRKSLPYLMLPPVSRRDGKDDIRQLCSLIEGESIVGEVPALTTTKFCFESLGWLLTVELDGSMSMLDPFYDTEIPVPHLHTFQNYEGFDYDKRFLIQKMVLSSRPNDTSDFLLMVIVGDCSHLAFWRLGDKAWNKIDGRKGPFCDVMYGGGEQFYAISCSGSIWAINLAAGHVEGRIIKEYPFLCVTARHSLYILKTIYGSTLVIKRIRGDKYLTSEFEVYDIDIETGACERIYSLGRMAIFLGRNSSFALDATATASYGGVIKANHIYFTDDLGEYQNGYFNIGEWRSYAISQQYAIGRSVDNGVFNFETGVIEPIYHVEPLLSNVCPAMWITPNYVSNN